MAKKKFNLGDKSVDAEIVEFEADKEQWSTYILHDGSALKIKAVVTEILRLEGVYAPNGDPAYAVHSQQVVSVNPPEHLKKGN